MVDLMIEEDKTQVVVPYSEEKAKVWCVNLNIPFPYDYSLYSPSLMLLSSDHSSSSFNTPARLHVLPFSLHYHKVYSDRDPFSPRLMAFS
jgi:hypothetical protein